ncbi:FAS1-like dehydratase domain-containing protein [Brevibacterium luteolum]|uniref:FAS1-like dehydratase domain-containing protein n=1 Tax=Brevibacterium luteolum TaxID=199591 RepID=UPI00223BB26B|nr:MaoC family dehydratase N-terminal domain-containing protein [Brevibacterium luteolum]MCT1658303.1 MaoC family dehydratase N-terminal domain-containing protein [Brevibacterium luteolum]
MDAPIDVSRLREWVGRSQTLDDIATEAKSRTLAAALDYDADPWGGQLFPLAHWAHFNPTEPQHALDIDGHPQLGGFLPPVPLPRRMWAGSELTFHRPITVGQQLQDVQTVTDVSVRTGRTGQLIFVTVTHEISADGSHAITDRHTIVYCEAAAPQQSTAYTPAERAARKPADTSAWDYGRIIRPDETLLFRYSALTFNAHRIHYDRDFCINEEGYPGLVVHGPLLATLMLDAFLRLRPDEQIDSFSFTARRPVFDGTPVAAVGRQATASATEVAILDPAGHACLTGTIDH